MDRLFSLTAISARMFSARRFSILVWRYYRTRPRWKQAGIAILFGLAVGMLVSLFGSDEKQAVETALPTVRTASIASFAGGESTVSVIGLVRSVTEAEILAQSGGTVTALRTRLGSRVAAGSVIAELENAAQRAAVLQAEGAYEAAIAARSGTSPADVATAARNTYSSAFTTFDTLLTSEIDAFFGKPTAYGPEFLMSHGQFPYGYFSQKRLEIERAVREWRDHLSTSDSEDPQTLLLEADRVIRLGVALGNDLSETATRNTSDASSEQLSSLSTARAGFSALLSSITAAKSAFQGQNTSATAGADASVKIALGSLRAAQAQLEKTLIRAPIAGTINFLPIRVGEYVTQFMHVATVAQNGTLELVAHVSESARAELTVGTEVTIEDHYRGTVTAIAPALDPVTKQIEIRIAVIGQTPLVNGQSVRIALPGETEGDVSGTLLIPLTALKLTPSARVVFSVGADDRLVAHPVLIGEVHGDRIEILSPLSFTLKIVTDARGFSEGQKVTETL
jgi:RND family efflux transporter MFP subunit